MKWKNFFALVILSSLLTTDADSFPEDQVTLLNIHPPVWSWTDKKVIFNSSQFVQIGCRIAEEPDILLIWDWKLLKGNPLFAQANISVQTKSKFVRQPPFARDIFLTYDLTQMVNLVQVKCTAIDLNKNNRTISSKSIFIEQLYPTSHAVIQDDMFQAVEDLSLQAGQTKKLTCVTDGNPPPDIRWFRETPDGVQEFDKKHPQVVIKQDDELSLKRVSCRVQNQNSTNWIYSPWVTASSPPAASHWNLFLRLSTFGLTVLIVIDTLQGFWL